MTYSPDGVDNHYPFGQQPGDAHPAGKHAKGKNMFKFSRYWNRIAYFIIHLGRKMIWDQTGRNADIIENGGYGSKTTEIILCAYGGPPKKRKLKNAFIYLFMRRLWRRN